MIAQQRVTEGNLTEALAELQNSVRADPSDAKLRVFLFQLLSVMGDWKRALTQLNLAGQMDAGNLLMSQMYGPAIQCEVLRAEIFAGRRSPMIFGEPGEWIGPLVEAVRLIGIGEIAAGEAQRAQALEQAPATSGAINDEPFEWIADADPRLGPILEVIIAGKHYWVPFERIAEVRIDEPTDLRDMVWTPASFRWTNGGEAVGLIPTRYPGSENEEDAIRLARKTDWRAAGEELQLPLGQRLLATDQQDYALLETRTITLKPENE